MSKHDKHSPRSPAQGAASLRNIGPTSARWLEIVGVHGLEDLEALGVVETFLRVRDAGFSSNLNLLWALQGAIMNLHWAEIPPEIKAHLRRAVEKG